MSLTRFALPAALAAVPLLLPLPASAQDAATDRANIVAYLQGLSSN